MMTKDNSLQILYDMHATFFREGVLSILFKVDVESGFRALVDLLTFSSCLRSCRKLMLTCRISSIIPLV